MITWARICQRIDQLVLGHDDDRPVTGNPPAAGGSGPNGAYTLSDLAELKRELNEQRFGPYEPAFLGRTEPPLSDDDLVAVRQLIEDRWPLQTPRAEGTQRAQAPGEASGDSSPASPPSPGDYPAAANQLAVWRGMGVNSLRHSYLGELIPELRDAAAQFAADESESQSP